MSFRLGTYIATQFKPIVAKTIYDMTDAKTVLDTSMGWGDRLTGFFASNATHYIGCDPNPNTFKRYKDMIEFWNSLTGNKKTTQIYNCGAEDLPWDEIKNVDCAFTSPPYFSTEDIMRVVKKKNYNRGLNLMNMNLGEITFIYQYHKKHLTH